MSPEQIRRIARELQTPWQLSCDPDWFPVWASAYMHRNYGERITWS